MNPVTHEQRELSGIECVCTRLASCDVAHQWICEGSRHQSCVKRGDTIYIRETDSNLKLEAGVQSSGFISPILSTTQDNIGFGIVNVTTQI